MTLELATMYSSNPSVIISLGAATIVFILLCVYTWIASTVNFILDTKRHQRQTGDSIVVPLKPYVVPALGSTLSMLNTNIGQFWNSLLDQCQKYELTTVSLLIAGTRTYIFFSPSVVLREFKAKQLTRQKQARQLGVNALGMSKEQAERAFSETLDPKRDVTLERVHTEFLLATAPVTTMTNKFMECLLEKTMSGPGIGQEHEVELYAWMKDILFYASINAVFGTKLLDMFPDLGKDFWIWEKNLLTLLVGTPRILARSAYAARESMLAQLEAWLRVGYKHTEKEDLGNTDWEPYFGAKVMRKRHDYYNQQGLNLRSQAGKELIFLAGVLSNAIPTAGWLVVHIFDPSGPPDFVSTLREEVKTAQRADGTFDVPALTRLPRLNAAVNEVLRLYIDLLIIRQVDENENIGKIAMRKGDQIMASSWMAHRNTANFEQPEKFDPTRFLYQDPHTGETTCSIQGLGGKYFPFGGGHHMYVLPATTNSLFYILIACPYPGVLDDTLRGRR